MIGLQALDMAVGIIFIYLVLSLACTAANEIIAGLFDMRAGNLETGIKNLLSDNSMTGLEKKFYRHPMIKSLGLAKSKEKKPSYIAPHTFRLVLLDLVASPQGENRESEILDDIRKNINGLPADSSLRKMLLLLLDDAKNDLPRFHSNIEEWYNNSMDRIAGWYKQKAQIITVIIAFVIAFGFNADTFQMARSLVNDPAIRQAIIQQAQETARKHLVVAEHDFKKIKNEIDKTGLPFGWENTEIELLKNSGLAGWITKIAGLLITTLAISLGAPFWFDTLNKIAHIRVAGPVGQTEKTNHA